VNSYAAAYGRAEAKRVASSLSELPMVVVDSKDELSIDYPGITRLTLPGEPARLRYDGLRLLLASDQKYFLIPDQWTRDTGAVLVLADTDSIRIQLLATQ
jgi:hypothetical protein